jgi:hypothetical protein
MRPCAPPSPRQGTPKGVPWGSTAAHRHLFACAVQRRRSAAKRPALFRHQVAFPAHRAPGCLIWSAQPPALGAQCAAPVRAGLTRRSTGPATARRLGRAAPWFILHRAAQAPCLRGPVNSNVRPHKRHARQIRKAAGAAQYPSQLVQRRADARRHCLELRHPTERDSIGAAAGEPGLPSGSQRARQSVRRRTEPSSRSSAVWRTRLPEIEQASPQASIQSSQFYEPRYARNAFRTAAAPPPAPHSQVRQRNAGATSRSWRPGPQTGAA